MLLFKRNIRLTSENLETSQTLDFSSLNVNFEVERTLEKEPSTLRAMVYNLSKDTRAILEDPSRKLVSLSVGYGADSNSLFVGDLRLVRHVREGANIVTTLEAGDGEKGALNWAKKWFPKNTGIRTIFEYLIREAQVGKGNLDEALAYEENNGLPDTIRKGMFVRGYALDELNELANSRGLDFSVQSNECQFTPIAEGLDGVPVPILSPTSGLVSTPTFDNEGIMSCTAKLVPNVFPGSIIEIDSEFVKGRYKVRRVFYTGSLFDSAFEMDIEGKAIRT